MPGLGRSLFFSCCVHGAVLLGLTITQLPVSRESGASGEREIVLDDIVIIEQPAEFAKKIPPDIRPLPKPFPVSSPPQTEPSKILDGKLDLPFPPQRPDVFSSPIVTAALELQNPPVELPDLAPQSVVAPEPIFVPQPEPEPEIVQQPEPKPEIVPQPEPEIVPQPEPKPEIVQQSEPETALSPPQEETSPIEDILAPEEIVTPVFDSDTLRQKLAKLSPGKRRSGRSGIALTKGEKETILGCLRANWSIPQTPLGETQIDVILRFKLTRNGALLGRLENDPVDTNNGYAVVALRNAQAAIVKCAPFTALPAEKYAEWRIIQVLFNPKEFQIQ